jgi:putative aldouronate transport system substrate-binding protein
MRRRFISFIAVIMALVLTSVLVLGCGDSQQAGDKTSDDKEQAKGNSPEDSAGESNKKDVKFPLAQQLTLSYFVGAASNVTSTLKDYNGIEGYKELEKRTNIHIDFQHPPSGQERDNFNLMIASGKLPDVIEWNWATIPGGPEKALKDGTIIRLNEYIDQHAPNLSRILKEHPEWKKQASTDDGSIYMFPFIRGDKYLTVFYGPTLRQDWLDKLKLQVPTTIDEWYTVLKAIKEGDPNGNGKPDEIPLSIAKGNIDYSKIFVGAWGITTGFFQENGQVKFGPLDPRYKEFLAVMNRWYNEGLLNRDYAAVDGKLMDAMITGNQLGSTAMFTLGGIGRFSELMASKDPNFKLVPAPYPVLNKGEKPHFGQMDFQVPGTGAALTSKNEHIIQTVKWLDYKYGEEGHLLFNFGIEGQSYDMVSGYPKYTDLILNNPEGLSVKDAMGRWFLASFSGPILQDKRYLEQALKLQTQRDAVSTIWQADNSKLMPNVTPTKEESSKFASIMNDVNTYHDEMFNKFVMGAESLDNYDMFVQTLKSMGVEDAIKIQQGALERFNKR